MLLERTYRLVLAAILAVTGSTVAAGDWGSAMRDAGDYLIYYNAVPASELDPWVAETYGLPRSGRRCVVTVAVLEKGSGEPVAAEVTAEATRADGRMYQIRLRAISDNGGRYYVGEVPVEAPTTLDFTLRVRPGDGSPPQTVRFERRFPAG